MWEHSHSLYPGRSIHSQAHRHRDNKTVLWHCTGLFYSLILVGNHVGGSRPGLANYGWEPNLQSPTVIVSESGHSHTYYILTDHGWFHAVTAEASSCGRNCRAPKAQGIWLLQNKFVDYYPKDWRRRQSSYLQSLQPHGVDRLINDQLGYEKNKTTTKRPNRKFLQNYCSAWERLTCEPAFDITGFL